MEILKSTRFQAVVIFAVISYLASLGYMNDNVFMLFATILGGHIGIKTIDRFAEKIGGKK